MMYWVLAGVGLVALYLIWLVFDERKLRQHRGVSREEFVAHFKVEGIPETISGTAYDLYKKHAFSKSFSPAPDMNFAEALNEDEEEVEDALLEMLKRLKIQKPSKDDLLTWSGGKVETIGDLVRWVYWASKLQVA